MSEEKLKPCPFCGNEVEIYPKSHPYLGVAWVIICNTAPCYIEKECSSISKEEAIKAWNIRVHLPQGFGCKECSFCGNVPNTTRCMCSCHHNFFKG